MRLIDADALIERYGEPCHSFLDVIEVMPTIDAEPVRHGAWVHDDLGRTFCSECTRRIPYLIEYDSDFDWDNTYDAEIDETEYCPNCGAKMDRGAADE